MTYQYYMELSHSTFTFNSVKLYGIDKKFDKFG